MARFLRWTLLLAVVATGIWYYVAPRRAYDRFLKAIAFGNAEELEATVNFPVLRMQLREDLRTGLERSAGKGPGATIALSMLGALVDAAVTPEGLNQIVTGFGTRDLSEVDPDSLTEGTATAYRYRSPSQVDVVLHPVGQASDAGGTLTFRRDGLSWKLTRAWSPRLLEPGSN
jgi:hypothetical protein